MENSVIKEEGQGEEANSELHDLVRSSTQLVLHEEQEMNKINHSLNQVASRR